MRLELIVLLALTWCVTSRDNDDDVGRPYEFGFTIDGQQHRHESKDVNGIIMGEFGFITADGVYHVTVYATDENGSFKILSMKNVKISEPLDQPGFEFPSRTPAGFMMPISAVLPPIITTTTQRPQAPYDFTTVPSLNVASCSSCKLPSTTQRVPGAPNKLPFQTPAFQNPPKINGNQQIIIQNGAQPPNQPSTTQRAPGAPNKLPFQTPAFQNPPKINENQQIIIQNGAQPPNQPANNLPSFPTNNKYPPIGHLPLGNPPTANQPIFPPNNQGPYTGNSIPSTNDRVPQQPSIEQQPPFGNAGNNIQPNKENHIAPGNFPASPFIPGPPSISPNYPISAGQPPFTSVDHKLPPKTPITITNQQINIPGREPIPIKDPYPNMVPGLPNGITENDMLDILYKFNYTLGFHGHHEKGLKNGTKIGAYFVNGRDGISRVVEYVADENGYRPKFKFVNLGLDSSDTPKEGSEKKFGLKGFEFVWFPV